ncbi:MAG TPA: hypothetical protein VMV92_32935 [Streptosporangiaceae bacterium]|nr:hypothetical protein [Streptosporangiaceae bacterium]
MSGYAASPGNPAPERLELATIYLRYAASAIERGCAGPPGPDEPLSPAGRAAEPGRARR